MRQRRRTDTIVTDRALKRELISHCSHPEIMEEILRRADKLAFTERSERTYFVQDLVRFCESQPCILWTPHREEHSRHLTVRIQFAGEAVVSITRVMWAAYHVVPEQGDHLTIDEEIIHSCANVADANTGWNACLNPAHLVKMDAQDRAKMSEARRLMRKFGMLRVAS